MKDNKKIALSMLSGIIFLLLVTGIRHLTNQDLSIIGYLSAFLFGAVIGMLGSTPHTSFIKNLSFTAAIIWLIWAAFTPITVIGTNWVINKPYLVLGITAFIILAEKEFWNIFKKIPSKKIGVGFISAWFLFWLMNVTGVSNALFTFLENYPLQTIILILIWWIIILVFGYITLWKLIKKIWKPIRGMFK